MWLEQDGLANPNRGLSHFPYKFWSSYEYLIRYEHEDPRAHEMGWLLSLVIFSAHSPISFNITCLLLVSILEGPHLTTHLYHSKIGVRLRWVIELGTSSLRYVCTSRCLLNIVGRMYDGTAHSKVWGSLHAHNHDACTRGSGGEGPGQQLDTKCQDGVQPLRDTKVWAAEIRGEPGRCVHCRGDSEATSARAGVGPFGHHSGRCVHQSRTTSRWRSEAFLNDTIIRAHCMVLNVPITIDLR